MIQKIKAELKRLDDALVEYRESITRLEAHFPGDTINRKDKPLYDEELDCINKTANERCGAAYDALCEITAELYREQPRLVNMRVNENGSSAFPEALSFGRLRLAHSIFKNGREYMPRPIAFPLEKGIWFPSKKFSLHHVWALLLGLFSIVPTGKLEIYAADPVQLGKSLEPFLPLVSLKSLFPSGSILRNSRDIETMLSGLDGYISGLIQQTFAAGNIAGWKAYNDVNKDVALPYKVLILVSMPEQLTDAGITYLKRILTHGPACGVLPLLLVNEAELSSEKATARHKGFFDDIRRFAAPMDGLFPVSLFEIKITETEDELPGDEAIKDLVEAYKQKSEAAENAPRTVDMLFIPMRFWQSNSADEIAAPVGWTKEGNLVNFCFGDAPAHGLLGGITRSGKTNLLHVMIQSLCFHYSPVEMHLYLMDFKDGLEFKLYTNPPLPHAQYIAAVGDPETGASALEHLVMEMKDRFEQFKDAGVANFIQYRKTQKLPRILVIIDEFQELFKDKRSEAHLNDLLRKCGAAGMHILLATQTLHGLQTNALSQLTANLGCRIALKCGESESRLILDGSDDAVNITPQKEAILNNAFGNAVNNVLFTHPKAEPEVSKKNLTLFAEKARKQGFVPNPRIVLNSNCPELPVNIAVSSPDGLCLELGTVLGYNGEPLRITLKKNTGSNILIAGAGDRLHDGLLGALLKSAATQVDEIILCGDKTALYQDFEKVKTGKQAGELEWDTLISDGKRRLIIIDELETQRQLRFSTGLNSFGPKPLNKTEKSPGESFASFLENGAAAGIHLAAFCRNWITFSTHCKGMMPSFMYRVVFNFAEPAMAGEAAGYGFSKGIPGLNDEIRAFFNDMAQNVNVSFRPYVLS
jgi:hypothetical protein